MSYYNKNVHNKVCQIYEEGFPGSLTGKESACNAEDPSLIPGSGRSAGEGIDYPLQDSWASLVPRLVKNMPAMQETWVRSLGWEDPLEKGTAIHSSILAWRIPWTVIHGSQRVRRDFHFRVFGYLILLINFYLNYKYPFQFFCWLLAFNVFDFV